MNVTFDKTDNVSGVLTVNVEVSDYADKVKKELKHISDTHVIPGFRKGHVPASILRRNFGKQVKSDIINRAVYEEVMKYIRDNKLEVLGQPIPEEVKEIGLDDGDYTFSYKIALTPDVDVVVDKSVKLPFSKIKVTDAMIDEQDRHMRESYGKQVPGDEVDEKAVIKGELRQLVADGAAADDAIVTENAIVGPFAFASKEEAAKFLGKKVGDKVVFNPWKACGENVSRVSSMLNVSKEVAENAKGDFEMTINEIIVVKLAELGAEYYDEVFGKDAVKDEKEYRERIKAMIAADLERQSRIKFDRDARQYFLDKYASMELPEDILKLWLVGNHDEFTKENIDEEFPKILPDLRWQILSDKIAEKLGTKVTEEDIKEMAKYAARQQLAQYGMMNAADDMAESLAGRMLADGEYRNRLARQMSDMKLMTDILNAVTLDTKEVSLEDFSAAAK